MGNFLQNSKGTLVGSQLNNLNLNKDREEIDIGTSSAPSGSIKLSNTNF